MFVSFRESNVPGLAASTCTDIHSYVLILFLILLREQLLDSFDLPLASQAFTAAIIAATAVSDSPTSRMISKAVIAVDCSVAQAAVVGLPENSHF